MGFAEGDLSLKQGLFSLYNIVRYCGRKAAIQFALRGSQAPSAAGQPEYFVARSDAATLEMAGHEKAGAKF